MTQKEKIAALETYIRDLQAELKTIYRTSAEMSKMLAESVEIIKKQQEDFHTMTVELRSVNILRAVDACGPDCLLRKSLERSKDGPSTTAHEDQFRWPDWGDRPDGFDGPQGAE